MVLAIEVDALRGQIDWRKATFVRAFQIAQWTLEAQVAHPILLDVLGHGLRKAKEVREAEERGEEVDTGVLDWTGPGAL